MNAAPHTPGPWSVDEVSEYTGAVRITAANGDVVARAACYGPQSETPHAQAANARLIAAAPELLEALRGLHEAFELASVNCTDRVDFSTDPRPAAALAAIAQATRGAS